MGLIKRKTAWILMALGFFVVGWYLGYARGAINQVYFDSPAMIVAFERLKELEGADRSERIEQMIFRQRCILANQDSLGSLSIYHPIHEEVRKFYQANIDSVCGIQGCSCRPGYPQPKESRHHGGHE